MSPASPSPAFGSFRGLFSTWHYLEFGRQRRAALVLQAGGEALATLTFGSVIFLLGALAPFPPLALQNFQTVVLLQLEDGQIKLVPEDGACGSQESPEHRT